jgi:hypothetical protein
VIHYLDEVTFADVTSMAGTSPDDLTFTADWASTYCDTEAAV